MRLVDLSHPIHAGTPVYPGTEPPRLEPGATIAADGFAETVLRFFSHTGTHMDAPAHVIEGAKTLDRFPVDAFQGPACLLDLRGLDDSEIALEPILERRADIERSDFLILRAGWAERWGRPDYFEGFPTLSLPAARWLAGAEAGLKGIGLDMISVDAVGSEGLPVHQILLGAEILIVENLCNLDALPERGFQLACHPLKFAEADGAPVRAVASIAG